MLKRIIKIIYYVLVTVILLMAVAAVVIQIPRVQTYLGQRIIRTVSKRATDAKISFDDFKIKPFNTLIIKNLVITDNNPYMVDTASLDATKRRIFRQMNYERIDTLFRAGTVIAKFSLRGLTGSSIILNQATVRDARINLTIEDGEHATNLTRMFRIAEKQNRDVADKDIVLIKNVETENLTYAMKLYRLKTHDIRPGGINWNDLEINNISIRGRNLRIRGKVISGEVDNLSFTEKSGFELTRLSAITKVGGGTALIENLTLVDPWSEIDIPHFSMHYDGARDFADYPNKVTIWGDISNAKVSTKTLGYFSPRLKDMDFELVMNGGVRGTINSFSLNGLGVSTNDGEVSGTFEDTMEQILFKESALAALKLKDIHFSTHGLGNLLQTFGVASQDIINPESYTDLVLNGSINGGFNDLKFNGYIHSDAGSLVTDLRVENLISRDKDKEISGVVRTTNLDLNEIIPKIPVKECSMDAGLRATISKGEEASSITIDSLKISRLNFMDYNYSGIAATGTVSGSKFDGKVICNDPNLNFLFQGIFTLSRKTNVAIYRFYANLGYADLFALNLDKRGFSRAQLQASVNFTQTGDGELIGDMDVVNLILENNTEKYEIGDISVDSFAGNDQYRVRLNSQFADAWFTGTAPITTFYKDLVNITAKAELPAMFKDGAYTWNGEDYEFSMRTTNSMDILSFLSPGVYVAANTTINAKLNSSGIFEGIISSPRIAYKENYIKDLRLDLSNTDSTLTGVIKGESINAAGVTLNNSEMKATAKHNHFGAEFSYDNADDDGNRGDFALEGTVGRSPDNKMVTEFNVLPTNVFVNTKAWDILPSEVTIKGKDVQVKDFCVKGSDGILSVRGRLSQMERDTLNFEMQNIDVSALNPLLSNQFNLRGLASGDVKLTSPKASRGFIINAAIDSSRIAGEQIGQVRFTSDWNDSFSRMDIEIYNTLDGEHSFSLIGNYSPSQRWLNLSAELTNFRLGYTAPFLSGIFSEIGGYTSGIFHIEGPWKDLSVVSHNANLNEALMRVDFTNVAYTASGPFHVDDLGAYFDDITITDRYGSKGKVEGKIGFDHFRNINFDTNIRLNRMEVMDLDENQGKSVYGHLFATGNVALSGPMSEISLTADITTTGTGDLHIPTSNSTLTAGSTDLLKFKEVEIEREIDPYEEMLGKYKKEKRRENDFAFRMKAEVQQDVDISVEIDKASGNVMKGRGEGLIDLAIHPNTNDFDITGNYTINSGNYHFVVLGIAARDFSIEEGSTIGFGGDLMNSNLNIDATYKTKASLNTLIADTTSTSSRRTVECGIKVTDKLSNPHLAFSINIPDLDPTVKARVESALSTEDKVQKQFLSLLISNSFLPDESSGIVNNSTLLYSNVSEIMSGQLNTIFQRLNIPLDMGLNYQQTDSGNDVFDVAVSTQLFNNRVEINGNIGNRQYQSTSSRSEVVGDIDIDIKLDRRGSFRLNLFSHSADDYTNYLDTSQRNGLGIAYQQEFNKFGQFVRRIFKSRKRREQEDIEDIGKEVDMVEIKVNTK